MISEVAQKCAGASAIIDTNILVVYIVGLTDPELVGRTKKTKAYSPEDFHALDALLGKFGKLVTFPNIVTETSNLLEKSESHIKYRIIQNLHSFLEILHESYTSSASLGFDNDAFVFGVTDHVILRSVQDGLVLISDDFELTERYRSLGGDALNFNHIRDEYI
jgi:hypothetical protein